MPAAVVLAGCGGDDGLPGNAVAKIGDTTITKAQFESAEKLQLLAVSQQLTANGVFKANPPKLLNFSPPYTECTNALKKVIPKEQQAQAAPDQLVAQCKPVLENAKTSAIQALLVRTVAADEAKKYKLTAPAAEVNKQVEALYTQLLGGKQNLAKFTTLTGGTVDDLKAESTSTLLLQKIQAKITKDNSTVTDADVLAYYNKNKKQYSQPESRNVHIVLTKTEADAKKARTELDGGAKFADVAKKYSTDQVTKSAGGKLEGVTKGQQEKGLEDAIFATAQTKLAGPVKTETGWYVVRVDKITPAQTIPFDKVKTVLKQTVQQSKPQEALQKWQDDVVKEYKKKTDCREGYNQAVFCKNQPKPKTTTAPGAATTGQ
ncbi:peptidyl-prolyl cis-trans isomerase [Patulibacter minatonensis]|uniref:peptidyl-prolyl cis-trans isomerase n=1 Tax=Patulibacter minatonensis TaxID=298163 RepID=UPI00146FA417|nr:peptidyl-prolyl cis-trans isomerase [Patulibacter minatonensis]